MQKEAIVFTKAYLKLLNTRTQLGSGWWKAVNCCTIPGVNIHPTKEVIFTHKVVTCYKMKAIDIDIGHNFNKKDMTLLHLLSKVGICL